MYVPRIQQLTGGASWLQWRNAYWLAMGSCTCADWSPVSMRRLLPSDMLPATHHGVGAGQASQQLIALRATDVRLRVPVGEQCNRAVVRWHHARISDATTAWA